MPLPSVRRMQIMSKHYPVEQRERAVKMVLDHLDEYRSVYAACRAIGPKVGVGAESLRRWVLQAQVDASARPGVTTVEQQRIRDLEREVRDLKEIELFFSAAAQLQVHSPWRWQAAAFFILMHSCGLRHWSHANGPVVNFPPAYPARE